MRKGITLFFWRQSRFWLMLAILLVAISLMVTFMIDYVELKKREIPSNQGIPLEDEQAKLYGEYLYSGRVGDKTKLIVEIKEINQAHAIGKMTVVTRDKTFTTSKYILMGEDLADSDHFFKNYESPPVKWARSSDDYNIDKDNKRIDGILKLSNPDIIEMNGQDIAVFSKDDVLLRIENEMLFPFDQYSYSIPTDITLLNDQGEKSASLPLVEIRDETNSSLLTSFQLLNKPTDEKTVVNQSFILSITYDRPAYVIASVLAVVILSLVVSLWTFVRLFQYNERNSEILAITISLAVSIPAFRQIQVPNEIMFTPLYDLPLLIVWCVSVLTIFAYMIRRNEEKGEDTNNADPEQQNRATDEQGGGIASSESDALHIDQEKKTPEPF